MVSLINLRLLRIIFFVLVLTVFCPFTSGKIIYVDDDVTGANDGTNWTDAYVFLQDALADANDSDKPVEIRVAQGLYKPDQGTGIIPGDPNATFQLINGVTLSGGYAGIDTNDPNARDAELYETILSGDLNGDDEPVVDLKTIFDETSRYDNSHNIVTAEYTDNTAVLDGVTVTAGFANDVEHIVFTPGPPGHPNDDYRDPRKHSVGGGLYCYEASPVIANCTFVLNAARRGGGIYNYTGEPNLINCRFVNNTARSYSDYGNSSGGGLCNDSGKPVMTGCEFIGNLASSGAGISDSSSSDMIVTNCIFNENSADYGGGICADVSSNLSIQNCKFTKNSASELGGGMSCWECSNLILTYCRFTDNCALGEGGAINSYKGDSQLIDCVFENNYAYIGGGCVIDSDEISFINCAFIGNKALSEGGGLSNSIGYSVSNVYLKNCLFTGNSSGWIGGAINFQENNGEILNCTISHNSALYGEGLCFQPFFYRQTNIFKITNSILWGGSEQIYNVNNSKITITYSNIQGGWEGEGNTDEDPLFVKPGYWTDINDPNIVVEQNDPNAVWVDGDYYLKSQAGRFDPNSGNWVIDDVTSPCIDAGDPNSPIGDEPFPNGGIINMGAYGGTAEASKSP